MCKRRRESVYIIGLDFTPEVLFSVSVRHRLADVFNKQNIIASTDNDCMKEKAVSRTTDLRMKKQNKKNYNGWEGGRKEGMADRRKAELVKEGRYKGHLFQGDSISSKFYSATLRMFMQ